MTTLYIIFFIAWIIASIYDNEQEKKQNAIDEIQNRLDDLIYLKHRHDKGNRL